MLSMNFISYPAIQERHVLHRRSVCVDFICHCRLNTWQQHKDKYKTKFDFETLHILTNLSSFWSFGIFGNFFNFMNKTFAFYLESDAEVCF